MKCCCYCRLERVSYGRQQLVVSDSYILYMEVDVQDADSILYSTDSGYMKVVGSGGGSTSTVLSVSTRITGFVQLNSSHVTFVDYYNHCLRTVNRLTSAVSNLAGSCGRS